MATLVEDVEVIARKNLPVCVLGDDQVDVTAYRLAKDGFPAVGTTSPQEALHKIRANGCRVVLVNSSMPEIYGLAFLDSVRQHNPGIYVILMTDSYSTESAIEAIKRGVYDYLAKPLDFARLERTLSELAESFAHRAEIRGLEEKLSQNFQFEGIVGKCPAMIEVFDLVRRVARHYTNALITGPPGSGKELVARALQHLSPVAHGPYAVFKCVQDPNSDFESDLFGHIRGSFTGATDTRPGLFEHADGGTVLLDEIGETSLAMQAKLLRVIRTREVQHIGSSLATTANVRIIATTQRDLRAEVISGRFREDLFLCLSELEIRVPGLSSRPLDIPILIQHFWKKYGRAYGKLFQGFSRRAQIILLEHEWPGNIRELENAISSAAKICNADFIDVDDLPEYLQKPPSRMAIAGENWRPLPLHQIRETHIQRVLETCHGNRVRAAKMLGIGRTSLYRFLKRSAKQSAVARSRF